MTCDLVLEALLDADRSALSPDDHTSLGRHLQGCARCRRVAAQLSFDTQTMAVEMARVPRVMSRTCRSRPLVFAPVLVGALVLFVAMLRVPPPAPTRIGPVVVTHVAEVSVAKPAPAPGPAVSRRATPRLTARAFPRPVPIVPVSFTASKPAGATAGVSVDPPAGTRAVILQTSNPKIHVVWLY